MGAQASTYLAPKSINEKSEKNEASKNNANDNNEINKISTKSQREVELPGNAKAYYRIPIRKSNSKSNNTKSESKSKSKSKSRSRSKTKSRSSSSYERSVRSMESENSANDRSISESEQDLLEVANEPDKSKIEKSVDIISETERTKVTEKSIQDAFKNPHSTFLYATPVTNIVKEKVQKEGIFLENMAYRMNDEQTVYEIPLESVGLRMSRNRTTRSKVDPWRKHGALIKLCEIGGNVPEFKGKGRVKTYSYVKKGTQPPQPPKSKPLTTVAEYMTFKNRNS